MELRALELAGGGAPVWRRLPDLTFVLASGTKQRWCDVQVHSHELVRTTIVFRGMIRNWDDNHNAVDSGPMTAHSTPPEMLHGHLIDSPVVESLCFDIGPEMMRVLGDTASVFKDPVLVENGTAAALIPRFRSEMFSGDTASDLVLRGLVYEFVAEVSRKRGRITTSDAPGWLARAREMLQDNCSQNVSIEDVAIAVGVHPSHLARVFRQYSQESPGEFVRRLRLERATREIQTSTLSLKEIAEAAGFSDSAHFSREFKRHKGVSPSSFRRTLLPEA